MRIPLLRVQRINDIQMVIEVVFDHQQLLHPALCFVGLAVQMSQGPG